MHVARRLRNGGSMDQWMELAMRVQSIAQAGLTYGGTEYDKERYEERHGITPFFGFSLKVLSHDLS